MQPYLYIMISRTGTGFGKAIRRFTGMQYNHASLGLDREFHELYSFARRRHRALLSATIVKENLTRYTLNKTDHVDVVVFRLPVTEDQLAKAQQIVYNMYQDDTYLYNYLSVLTYPITKGFSTYKAFSCIEFVMFVLDTIGFPVRKSPCKYTPDEMMEIFQEYLFFEGNLLDFVPPQEEDFDYFTPLGLHDVKEGAATVGRILYRSIRTHGQNYDIAIQDLSEQDEKQDSEKV